MGIVFRWFIFGSSLARLEPKLQMLTVVTDAESEEKTENLPMILAQVEKNNFKPYKQGDSSEPTI